MSSEFISVSILLSKQQAAGNSMNLQLLPTHTRQYSMYRGFSLACAQIRDLKCDILPIKDSILSFFV